MQFICHWKKWKKTIRLLFPSIAPTILDVFRTMDAVYGDAETLVLPLDEELLAFCEAHLDVTPIHVSEPGRLYR